MTFQIDQIKAEGFLFPYIPLLFRLIETGRRYKAKYEKKQAIFSLAGRKLVPLPYCSFGEVYYELRCFLGMAAILDFGLECRDQF